MPKHAPFVKAGLRRPAERGPADRSLAGAAWRAHKSTGFVAENNNHQEPGTCVCADNGRHPGSKNLYFRVYLTQFLG